MKKIFLAVLLFSIAGTTTIYASGGKKKAKAKTKTECCAKECKKDKKCEPATCYPLPACKK